MSEKKNLNEEVKNAAIEEAEEKTLKKSKGGFQMGTVLALVLMCVILSVLNHNFYNITNIMSVLKQTAFNAFLATGMLLCLITAGIDLSVGANAIFCACIMGAMKQAGMSSGPLGYSRRLHKRIASYKTAPAAPVRIYTGYEKRTMGPGSGSYQFTDGKRIPGIRTMAR